VDTSLDTFAGSTVVAVVVDVADWFATGWVPVEAAGGFSLPQPAASRRPAIAKPASERGPNVIMRRIVSPT
jgi:hypothetical protein